MYKNSERAKIMEIKNESDMIKAIDFFVIQMTRADRKSFLAWLKDRRRQYDLLYPEGWKAPEITPPPSNIIVPVTNMPGGK